MESIISIIVSIIIFISDLKIKNHIESCSQPKKELCNGHIVITKLHNKGIMMGRLSSRQKEMKILLCVVMILSYIAYIPFLFKKGCFFIKLGFGMFFGGAWSNFYDHFIRGYVVDYIKIPHGFIKKIVFNISDFFIAAGAVIASIFSFF